MNSRILVAYGNGAILVTDAVFALRPQVGETLYLNNMKFRVIELAHFMFDGVPYGITKVFVEEV